MNPIIDMVNNDPVTTNSLVKRPALNMPVSKKLVYKDWYLNRK